MNENKIQHPNLWDAVKTALKEKIIAINAYIKNKKYVKSIKEQAKLNQLKEGSNKGYRRD